MKKLLPKLVILSLIGLAFYLFKYYQLGHYLSLDYVKSNQDQFRQYYLENKFQTLTIYFVVYVFVTALSIPGATVLTLAAGGLFGFSTGLFVVSFASSLGATLAFLGSRLLFRDYVQSKFKSQLESINRGFEKDGAFYLFSLRLIPIVPFFVINLVMGLTPIKTFTYYIVSQVGMLAGTAVYVNAGLQLSQLDSLRGIVSFKLLGSFALLGLFPLIAKKIVYIIKSAKVYRGYKKPKSFDYNMVAIGAGAGGLVTSYIGAATKAKVALIEKHKMGGDCLNTGCVPSKAIIKSAKVANYINNGAKYGVDTSETNVNFQNVMKRVHQVIKDIEPHDSVERYTSLGVDCILGKAKIISPWEIEVNGKTITTKNITIATGASPSIPPLKGIEKIRPLTSENLWQLEELPKYFVIIGGGPIGCEMAQSFSRLGSNVTLIQRSNNLLKGEDPEVSKIVEDALVEDGVKVLLNTNLSEVIDGKTLKLESGETIHFDQILFAVGRSANTRGFGLENLQVKLSENGTIETNEFMQTNYPNIFACGDVAGPYQLTHMAAHQAWYCAVNGLFGMFKKFKADYSVVSWATYTDPEVATVGFNEKMAKEKQIAYELTSYEIDDLDRAIAESELKGVVRVLTVPGSDKILGATIVANRASDMIIEFVSAMKNRAGLNTILGTIHAYPSMVEANKYVAGNWKKKNAPENLLKWVEKFHAWMRS